MISKVSWGAFSKKQRRAVGRFGKGVRGQAGKGDLERGAGRGHSQISQKYEGKGSYFSQANHNMGLPGDAFNYVGGPELGLSGKFGY